MLAALPSDLAAHAVFLVSLLVIISSLTLIIRRLNTSALFSSALLEANVFFFALVHVSALLLTYLGKLSLNNLFTLNCVATLFCAATALKTRRTSAPKSTKGTPAQAEDMTLLILSALCSLLVLISIASAYIKAMLIGDNTADGLWYHIPRLFSALQQGDTSPVGLPHIDNYHPKASTYWLAWVMAFYGDLRALQLALLPQLVLAMCAIYTIARKLGASASAAACGASSFAFLPVVSAQLGTSLIDIMQCSYILAAVALLADIALPNAQARMPLRQTWLSFGLALGLVLATKLSGLIYAAILLLCFAVLEYRKSKQLKLALTRSAASLCLALFMGAQTYLQNFTEHSNPFYPQAFDLFGIHLPGPSAPEAMWENSQVKQLSLPERFIKSWGAIGEVGYAAPTGGFGAHGPLLLLCLVLVPFFNASAGDRRRTAALLALCLLLLATTPFAYVPRYTLFLPGLGGVALALILDSKKAKLGTILAGSLLICANFFSLSQQWRTLRFELARLNSSALERCTDSFFPDSYSDVFSWIRNVHPSSLLVVSEFAPVSNACFWDTEQQTKVYFHFLSPGLSVACADIFSKFQSMNFAAIVTPRHVANECGLNETSLKATRVIGNPSTEVYALPSPAPHNPA
ncbi:MAG: hypothetical protein K1X79_04920 [Oligoflexia bacterium]|nr:hypothetical protein [Oligoflexia bacterium]